MFLGTVQGPDVQGQRMSPANQGFELPPRTGQYGPQFTTVTEAMAQLPRMWATNRPAYVELQRKLYRGGFYGQTKPEDIGLGAYNAQTINAYRAAVLAAAQLADAKAPVTFDELLSQNAGRPGEAGHAGRPGEAGQAAPAPPPPKVIAYTDPKLVAGAVQQASQAVLGRNLSTQEVQHFVSAFHAAQKAYGEQRYRTQLDTPAAATT